MTRLTVSIAAKNLTEAADLIETAVAAGAEAIELRTDYIENLNVELVRKIILEAKNVSDNKLPLIVTCRDKKQGGARFYPDQLRCDVLAAALKAGTEFIDFEYDSFLVPENREKIIRALSEGTNSRLILSAHNFEGAFDNIARLYRRILSTYPAAIPKLVYTAKHINDCFDALDLLHSSSGERIIFCMGQAGVITRIIAKKLGCFVTFAGLDENSSTAPGQLNIETLKKTYRYDDIDSETRLFGIIGWPTDHSLSPAIHNSCFAEARLNDLYLPLSAEGGGEQFDRFMDKITSRKWLGFDGFSVTIPHKQNALEYVRAKKGFIEPSAEKIGAANTVLVDKDGRLSAYNTDCAAAMQAVVSGMGIKKSDLKDMKTAVLGAGGVARAVVAGLSDAGAGIKIYNRTVKRGEKLAAEFNCDFAPLDDLPNINAKLLINCTSIGMHPNIDQTPVPKEYIKKEMAVFDTVYNPAETAFLKDARQIGAKTIDGLSMFVNQARSQFKLFTGRQADGELMRKTVSGCLFGESSV